MTSPPEGDVFISVAGARSLGCWSEVSVEVSLVGRVAAGLDIAVSVAGPVVSVVVESLGCSDVWFPGG